METKIYFLQTLEYKDSNEMNKKFESDINKKCDEENCELIQIVSKKESTMGCIDCSTQECWYPWYISCLFKRNNSIEISLGRTITLNK
jgi:hypothetical protein